MGSTASISTTTDSVAVDSMVFGSGSVISGSRMSRSTVSDSDVTGSSVVRTATSLGPGGTAGVRFSVSPYGRGPSTMFGRPARSSPRAVGISVARAGRRKARWHQTSDVWAGITRYQVVPSSSTNESVVTTSSPGRSVDSGTHAFAGSTTSSPERDRTPGRVSCVFGARTSCCPETTRSRFP